MWSISRTCRVSAIRSSSFHSRLLSPTASNLLLRSSASSSSSVFTNQCPVHASSSYIPSGSHVSPLQFTRSFASDVIYTQKIPKKKSSFRDRVRLHVSGGRGGAGCSSYDTDPYGKGGPDGANGGRGGDVYLVSTSALSNFALESFHLRGQNGQSGGSQRSKGRNGMSLKIPVPAGTVVSEILATSAANSEYTLRFLADLDREGLEIKVATGGQGGLGNRAFKTKYRKQARFSTVGQYGSAKWLYLELKAIADVGLVGYPNAGKSSFLAAVSNADPEIANYPFTTLSPQVGVVEAEIINKKLQEKNKNLLENYTSFKPPSSPQLLDSFTAPNSPPSTDLPSDALPSNTTTTAATGTTSVEALSRMSVADLPGLIAGASNNRGLGHEFLKHIQRTRILAFVIDVSGNDQRDPIEDFKSLKEELRLFDPQLLLKPAIILANKIDNTRSDTALIKQPLSSTATPKRKTSRSKKQTATVVEINASGKPSEGSKNFDATLARLAAETDLPIFPISCVANVGLLPAVSTLLSMVDEQRRVEATERAWQLSQGIAEHQAKMKEERRKEQEAEIREREEAFLKAERENPERFPGFEDEEEFDEDEDDDEEVDEGQLEEGEEEEASSSSKKVGKKAAAASSAPATKGKKEKRKDSSKSTKSAAKACPPSGRRGGKYK